MPYRSFKKIRVPQKFYTELGFAREAVCTVQGGALVIKPVRYALGGEFSEHILADLIAEGFSGEELLTEFKLRQAKVRPAVEAMLKDAKAAARGEGEYATYEEIFGSEE
jgi:hypothetical protein